MSLHYILQWTKDALTFAFAMYNNNFVEHWQTTRKQYYSMNAIATA